MVDVVVDTNVLVGALLSGGGAARRVLRACLTGAYRPLLGAALYSEYEDLLARDALWENALVTPAERAAVFDAFVSQARWVEVFFAWRPNLPDEADNHLIELAVAGNAAAIVTRNLRDLLRRELRFPNQRVLTPEQCLEVHPCPP
jgi:putative PIN family toxin of toxin-antitoxin system